MQISVHRLLANHFGDSGDNAVPIDLGGHVHLLDRVGRFLVLEGASEDVQGRQFRLQNGEAVE